MEVDQNYSFIQSLIWIIIDLDECLNSSVCDSTAPVCINVIGYYYCACHDGYQREQDNCKGGIINQF